jgi:Flp pilus assembly pilin Flp
VCLPALAPPFSHFRLLQHLTRSGSRRHIIRSVLDRFCRDTEGQDVAEYAIMLAVVLVIIIGMVRMIGANASTVFSQVGSAIQ